MGRATNAALNSNAVKGLLMRNAGVAGCWASRRRSACSLRVLSDRFPCFRLNEAEESSKEREGNDCQRFP
jgi:hypothetical protein